MVVLPINYVRVFYMRLCVSGESHIKHTYMISREYIHMMLPDYMQVFLAI